MPTAEQTAYDWIRHFASADRDLRWLAAEQELSISLTPSVILAGRIDALGVAGDHPFFGEWKSMSKWGKSDWREKWRFHPQSLTYGLLLAETHPEIDRFTIRVAIKSDPPTFDHEWFSYSAGELSTWRREVERIASDILFLRTRSTGDYEHWPLNPLNCYKYGVKYACPYVHACTHGEWNKSQPGAPLPYVPHLQVMRAAKEAAVNAGTPSPLVLDATAITAYLECPEAFRRRYVLGEDEPPSEALQFGSQLHSCLDHYYKQLAATAAQGASACPNA